MLKAIKTALALAVLSSIVVPLATAAGPAPCYFQSLWTQCGTPNIRVGTNAATTGSVTNPNQVYGLAGLYLDNSAAFIASATQTGYVKVNTVRTTSSSGTAFQVLTNYQDAQTLGSAAVTTNEKTALTITGNGVVSVPQGIIISGSAGTLNYYDTGTFNATWSTGLASACTATTIRYTRTGNMVCLGIPGPTGCGNISGTPSSVQSGATDVPSALRPGILFYAPLVLTLAGVIQTNSGIIEVGTGGLLRIYPANSASNYTSGNSWLYSPISTCYTIQ